MITILFSWTQHVRTAMVLFPQAFQPRQCAVRRWAGFMKCAFFYFMHQQSQSLLAYDVVEGPQDMPHSPLPSLQSHCCNRTPGPLISEQGNGPVVNDCCAHRPHQRLQCEEELRCIISWWGHGDLSWGIAGDLHGSGTFTRINRFRLQCENRTIEDKLVWW